MKYENDSIGDIIIKRNLIFKDNGMNELDHSWKTGRPCLIIYSDDQYDYFLTLTSKLEKVDKYNSQYFLIDESDLDYINTLNFNGRKIKEKYRKSLGGVVNLSNVYRSRICGHHVCGKVKYGVYKQIIKKFKEYHNYEDIVDIVENSVTLK